MVVAAHQPNFLPNLGFFYKMLIADTFVIFTNVKFERREGWQRRHKIQGPNNDLWLAVPVTGSDYQKIKEVRIDNSKSWRHQHRKTIEASYAHTPDRQALSRILDVYHQPWERLVDLNVAVIRVVRDILAITTPVHVDEEVSGHKEQLLVNMCKKYGATTYLSGMGGKQYMTPAYFSALHNIGVEHRFVDRNLTPEYPYSSVHYILKHGREFVQQILGRDEG